MSMSLGLGLGLTHRRGTSLAAKIRAIFRDMETGVWLDYSDASTLFQDAAGTTPAGIGDPVRLIRDKSGNENDALAPSDAARPVVGRVPVTGRRNLLTRTEEFDNAYWQKTGITASGVTITEDASTGRHRLRTAFESSPSGVSQTISALVEKTSVRRIVLNAVSRLGVRALFDISAGMIIDQTGSGASITEEGNFFRIELTGTGTGTSEGIFFELYPPTETSAAGSNYAGDPSVSLDILEYQLETGSTATPYQRVGSQFDVTEAGIPSAIYIRRDLIDDRLDVTLPAITDGKIIIGTTEGVWVDDLDFAGGTFSMGPTTYTGGPAGLYDAIGADELGTIILDRQPTEAELANIMKWFKSKGSPDNLITEPF